MENIMRDIKSLKPIFWNNSNLRAFDEVKDNLDFNEEDIKDAENRLERFAKLIKVLFPETKDGIIESKLKPADNLSSELEKEYEFDFLGKMFLKCDNELKVAGSIKARGGIYEVLKHAETIAIENDMLTYESDYSILAEDRFRELFSNYKIAVGSTGNLGLSIGIISATLGFKVYVHMSSDAKQWKKDLLRSKGVTVIEYDDDYGKAVEEGRKQSLEEENMYFIDDENSRDLFLGYSVAASRLEKQLKDINIEISKENPLHVYLPCGVGGAPGGITVGLKYKFGDNVNCYFVEPVNAPCVLVGLATGKMGDIAVGDIGIELKTEADGLAVGRPSELVCRNVDSLLSGEYTILDEELFKLLYLCKNTENVKIEPSAASSLKGIYLNNKKGIHISWLTGGSFVPDEIYKDMLQRGSL